MGKLLLEALTLADVAREIGRTTGCDIIASEQHGHHVYLAARHAGLTSALIVTLTPLAHPLDSGENLVALVQTEADNPLPAHASRSITAPLTRIGPLLAIDPTWRTRAAQWQARVKASQTGETMLGEYPDAEGSVGYNAPGKKAFQLDARRYLKAVLRELGWVGKVSFNPGGIAVSGDAYLNATCPDGQGLHICLSANGLWVPRGSSPSGVNGYWRFSRAGEGSCSHGPLYRNLDWHWKTPAQKFAATIKELYRFMFHQHDESPFDRSA